MAQEPNYVAQGAPEGLKLATSTDNNYEAENTHEYVTELDQNTSAFIEGFMKDSDPHGFLSLAGVPLHAKGADGANLTLLRVETVTTTDISHLAPDPDDDGYYCATVSAKFAGARSNISLVYYDGTRLVPLTLSEALSLAWETG